MKLNRRVTTAGFAVCVTRRARLVHRAQDGAVDPIVLVGSEAHELVVNVDVHTRVRHDDCSDPGVVQLKQP